MRRREYVEISDKSASVRAFLDKSDAYHHLVKIPQAKLSKANQKIFEALCNPNSFSDLDEILEKTTSNESIAKSTMRLFAAYVDENANFEYYLSKLKNEYNQNKNENTPLI